MIETKITMPLEHLISLYNSGYLAGHNDTVEGGFVDIHHCDMESYHSDIVLEWLDDKYGFFDISLGEMTEDDLKITPPAGDEVTYTCKCGLTCNVQIGQEYCSLCNRAIDLKNTIKGARNAQPGD